MEKKNQLTKKYAYARKIRKLKEAKEKTHTTVFLPFQIQFLTLVNYNSETSTTTNNNNNNNL